MNIAIIPARGGSKRIPRKNIKEFCGMPMIAYAITAAKESGLFEHIIVSTDDEEIARIANEYGAKTPFIRPAELANDFTPTNPVVSHAINACREIGIYPDFVCCIYACVPLIQAADIEGTFNCLTSSNVDSCYPVTEFPSAPQRALKRASDGTMKYFYPEFRMTRTQDLEPAYYDAGQFYWGKTNAWLMKNNIAEGIGYEISNSRVVDIDTPEDWKRAELYFQIVKGEVPPINSLPRVTYN